MVKIRNKDHKTPDGHVIDAAGEAKLKNIRKLYESDMENLEKEYKDKHETLMSKYGAGAEKSKLKFWAKSKTEDIDDPKYYVLVNAGAIKDFITYGANKVLDQIKVRTHSRIEARAEIAKLKDQEKGGIDAKQAAFTLLIVAVVACMAWVIISNFLDYRTVEGENQQLKKDLGDARGNLAACTTELSHYKGTSIEPAPPTSENTLEG